jgi:hypothetical protein
MQRYYEVHLPGTLDMQHKHYASATGAGWSIGSSTFITQKRIPPVVEITGSFTYTRCSSLSILATTTGYNASVTITSTGIYSVELSGLIYYFKFDAEI